MASVDPKAGSPFPGLTFCGELDDLESQEMEVTMTEGWRGYINNRVLTKLNRLHPGTLTHLRFLPDPDTGTVIMVPAANAEEYGSVALEYGPTLNGAAINLRLAVKRMQIRSVKGRVQVFRVVERVAPGGQTYLGFIVKGAETRVARSLRTNGAGNTAAQATVAASEETKG